MNELRNIKSSRCKSYRYPSGFIKDGRPMKTCTNCRNGAKKYRAKIQCEHNVCKDFC